MLDKLFDHIEIQLKEETDKYKQVLELKSSFSRPAEVKDVDQFELFIHLLH